MADALDLHKKLKGKIKIEAKENIKSIADLALLYTPGVAKPCLEIAKDKSKVYDYTMKGNFVAVVSDGTRVLGLGDIGPEAAMPVMEGKALIMQQFAQINSIPLCLNTKDKDEIIKIVKAVAPNFGAINLEDIETPKVFEIEKKLTEELDIPVFHDDQHGTAIVTLAALYNALKVLGKNNKIKIAINGAGSAGYAIAKLLAAAGFEDLIIFDSKGAIHNKRPNLEEYKKVLASLNKSNFTGPLNQLKGADVLISAAAPGSVPIETIKNMNKPNIVFALSNPNPEISIEQSNELKIDIFGSGRSDYPNQINNSLCFPGFLKALLDLRVKKITDKMKIAAAIAISESVTNPTKDKIVPDIFDKNIVKQIFNKVKSVI